MKPTVKPTQQNTCLHISYSNGLKQGDASPLSTFDFILVYDIRKVKGGLKLNCYVTFWSTMTT
jgi:hypothetical protein